MNKKKEKKIAQKRIEILFEEAKKAASKGKIDRSNRYAELARKIGMRHNISLDSRFKRRICENCHSYLHPGKTCGVRLKEGMLISKCFKCGTINRFKYKDG